MVDSLYCGLTLAMQDSLGLGRSVLQNHKEQDLNMNEYDNITISG